MLYVYDFLCFDHGRKVKKAVTVDAVSVSAGLPLARKVLRNKDGRVIERTAQVLDMRLAPQPKPVIQPTPLELHAWR